jgi:hypothetical protein
MPQVSYVTPPELIPKQGLVIEFPAVSDATAGLFAEELEREVNKALEEGGVKAEVQVLKSRPETQSIGTFLAIVLGAKATVALVNGLSRWMTRKNKVVVIVVKPDGTRVMLTEMDSKDVGPALAELHL